MIYYKIDCVKLNIYIFLIILVNNIFIQNILCQSKREENRINFTIRYCVPEYLLNECVQMANIITGSLKCVSARDKFECINLIQLNQADTTNLDPEDLYLAGKVFNLEPFVQEEYGDSRLSYQAKAAVFVKKDVKIRSLSDLRSKRTCHSSYGSETGWSIPIGILARKLNLFAFDCRGELHALSNFFNASCIPGLWSDDLLVDRQLKKQHEKLCSICRDSINCSMRDDYFGEEGAVKCVVNGDGDVAFTSLEAINNFFINNPRRNREDFKLLCLDGSQESISYFSCDWGTKPSNAFVIKKGRIQQSRLFSRYLEEILFRTNQNRPSWFSKVFVSIDNVTNLKYLDIIEQNYTNYLGSYIYTIEKSFNQCDEQNVTFCLSSIEEIEKCLDLAKVSLVRKIGPFIRCLGKFTKEECIEEVKMQRADIINLNPFEFYNASRYNNLKPIAREINNLNEINSYALAVVKNPSDIISFEGLRNATSCHSGFNTPAGWLYPVSVLVRKGLIDNSNCNRAHSLSDFFPESCAPGAAKIANPPLSGFDAARLCRLCVGNEHGSDVCEFSNHEIFFKDEGALRCLLSRRGDVAFVDSNVFYKHIKNHNLDLSLNSNKLNKNIDSNALINTVIKPENLRLICRFGGQRRIEEFEHCNLGKIPPSYIATSSNITYEKYLKILNLLTKLSDLFGKKKRDIFRLFGIYKKQSDLLFSDNAVAVEALEYTATYRDALGEFLDVFEDNDIQVCSSVLSINYSIINSIFIIFILYFINKYFV